jgi:hypothetical protein
MKKRVGTIGTFGTSGTDKDTDPFPPQADQPLAETLFATEGLLLAHRVGTAESGLNAVC